MPIGFMKNMKITPFFVLLGGGILTSVVVAIYFLSRYDTGNKAMTGILAIIIAFFLAVILIGERLLLRASLLSFRTVCKIEGIFIACLILAYFVAALPS
jgi:hypothetical protein